METLVLRNGIILTMDSRDRVIENGAIAIQGNHIVAVDRTDVINKQYRADQVIDAKGKAIIPGLVNTHMHSASLRGTADFLPFDQWLAKYIRP